MLVDSHLGDDGYTDAGADHAKDAAELATFENYLRIHARAVASSYGSVPKAVPVPKEEKRFDANIF
jgi:hypothetical protein